MPEVISLFRGLCLLRTSCTRLRNCLIQGLSNFLHEIQVVVQIVNRVQSGAENLIDLLQMVQVGAGEVATAVAVATLVERTEVMLMFSVSKLISP